MTAFGILNFVQINNKKIGDLVGRFSPLFREIHCLKVQILEVTLHSDIQYSSEKIIIQIYEMYIQQFIF